MPSLIKSIKAKLGDNYSKGDLFEDYITNLFPDDVFSVVQITPSKDDLGGRWIEQANFPDIRLRHKPSNHQFWVECKFRSSTYQNKLHWCEPYQLKRYKEIQESVRPEKIFVAIGLGGSWNNPESLYCIPLDEIEYPGLFLNSIEKFRRNPQTNFNYQAGRLF